jgi:hypothetical protein
MELLGCSHSRNSQPDSEALGSQFREWAVHAAVSVPVCGSLWVGVEQATCSAAEPCWRCSAGSAIRTTSCTQQRHLECTSTGG